jgi:hemerythrin-like metal-binding protein
MAYEWNKSYEIGNPAIDAQHKQLVDMFNGLMSACTSRKGHEEIERALHFLVEYTVKHFADEEEWQKKINYPEYKKHKQLHADFCKTVAALFTQFRTEGASSGMVVKLNSSVGTWLINHIRQEDAKIRAFLAAAK